MLSLVNWSCTQFFVGNTSILMIHCYLMILQLLKNTHIYFIIRKCNLVTMFLFPEITVIGGTWVGKRTRHILKLWGRLKYKKKNFCKIWGKHGVYVHLKFIFIHLFFFLNLSCDYLTYACVLTKRSFISIILNQIT